MDYKAIFLNHKKQFGDKYHHSALVGVHRGILNSRWSDSEKIKELREGFIAFEEVFENVR